jgi:hypothetical protein
MSWCRALLWGPWPDFTFFFPLPENCFVLRLGRSLWREDGSGICSAICQWLESRRTHNHTLLSHLRLLGSLSVASYDSQGFLPASTREGGPLTVPGLSCQLLRPGEPNGKHNLLSTVACCLLSRIIVTVETVSLCFCVMMEKLSKTVTWLPTSAIPTFLILITFFYLKWISGDSFGGRVPILSLSGSLVLG